MSPIASIADAERRAPAGALRRLLERAPGWPEGRRPVALSVLFIGTSHLACLMQAYADRLDELADVAVEFFAIGGSEAEHIFLDGPRVRVHVERLNRVERDRYRRLGSPEPDVRDYDAVLVFNNLFNIQHSLYSIFGNPKVRARYSAGYLEAAIGAQAEASSMLRLAAAIRGQSGRPTFLCHQPFRDRRDPDYAAIRVADADRRFVLGIFSAVARRNGLAAVEQPVHTIVDGAFTEPAYSIRSVAMNGRKHDVDYMHMNAAYGRLFLAHAIGGVRDSLTPAAVAARP